MLPGEPAPNSIKQRRLLPSSFGHVLRGIAGREAEQFMQTTNDTLSRPDRRPRPVPLNRFSASSKRTRQLHSSSFRCKCLRNSRTALGIRRRSFHGVWLPRSKAIEQSAICTFRMGFRPRSPQRRSRLAVFRSVYKPLAIPGSFLPCGGLASTDKTRSNRCRDPPTRHCAIPAQKCLKVWLKYCAKDRPMLREQGVAGFAPVATARSRRDLSGPRKKYFKFSVSVQPFLRGRSLNFLSNFR